MPHHFVIAMCAIEHSGKKHGEKVKMSCAFSPAWRTCLLVMYYGRMNYESICDRSVPGERIILNE